MLAVISYVAIGLLVGVVSRLGKEEVSSLVGVAGTGGAAGLVGGVLTNLIASGGITFDAAGVAGAAVLAILAVLVKRGVDRRAAAPADDGETSG